MVRSASRTSAPASNVLRQEIDLSPSIPPPNAPQEETLSFWEELCQVPEQQWASEHEKGFKVYLYDHEVARSPYLAVITHSFDVEWIKQNYGGGLYRAQLNDPAGRIVSKEIFAIDGDSKRKPPQNAQAAGVPQQQQQQPDSFQAQMLEIMREGQRRQEDLIRQLMDRNTTPAAAPSVIDPNVALKGVVEIFSGLVARAATPQPQMDFVQMFALVEKMRGPDLLTVLTQAKTAGLIPATGGGGDLMSQLSGVIEVAEKIGLTSGKGGKSLGEAVIEKLPDILEAGGKAMEKYQTIESTRLATAREVRAIQQQQRGTVITPPPQPPAGQVTQHAGSQPYVDAGPQANATVQGSGLDVESPGATPTPEAIADAERQLIFIKGKIVEAIANGDSGGEIIDFLDKIDKTICDQFAGASAEQIAYFFSSDPVLKKAASLPRFKPAIAEMVEELNAAPDENLEAPTKPN